MKFLLALLLAATPLAAQAPDSTRVDSTASTVYTHSTSLYFTRVVPAKPDTVSVPVALRSVVDTTVKGDSTFFLYSHEVIQLAFDSAKVRVALPSIVTGKPLGPTGLIHDTDAGIFTQDAGASSNKSSYVLANIAEARTRGIKVMLNLPCGAHNISNVGNCLRDSLGINVFAPQRFDSSARAILTPAVASAVIQAYRDGVVTGILAMDEPWVHATGDGAGGGDGNTWGARGLSKAQVDRDVCRVIKALVPGVPVGVSDNAELLDPSHNFAVCDFGQAQYSYRFGDVAVWRDKQLAMAARGGYQMTFSINPINGGTQDRDGVWDCKDQGGVKGQSGVNCSMTGPQILAAVSALGPAGNGGQMMWRYDATRFALPSWQTAFAQALALFKTLPYRPLTVR